MTVRRSLGIVAATRLSVFFLALATVSIVSRLLTPEEIGIFSVTMAVVGIGHVFRDFGVGQYLIQVKEVTRQVRRAAFTVTLSFSWCVAGVLWWAAPAIAAFYGHPGIQDVAHLIAVNFLILPMGAPLRTLLQRDMQFGKLAVVNLSNHLVQSCTTVACAWFGLGYLSMAWGSVAGNLANVLVLLCISPKGALDWPTRHGLREVLAFGSRSSVTGLAAEAGDGAPDLILGRTLGFADVALYSRARGLISMALSQLMYVVSSVYAPTFAKNFREGADPAALYARTAGLLLALTVPAIALLALLSPHLIALLFGAQWVRSGPLGSMLCLFALLTAPFALAGTSLVSSGHVQRAMQVRLTVEAVRIAVMLSSLALRLEAVVALLVLVYVIEAVLYLRALRASIGLGAGQLWAAVHKSYLLVPFALAGPALAVVAFALGDWPAGDFWVISLSLPLALAGWACGLVLLRHPFKPEFDTTVQLLRAKLRQRRG